MASIIPVTFQSDAFTLKGVLHLPAAKRPPLVIGCHGLMSTADSPKQIALARHCTDAGIAYFRFDHRGCGASEGRPAEVTSLEARCRDLSSARRTVQSMNVIGEKIGLFGSSMGGAVVLAYAGGHPVAAVVTNAALYRSQGIVDSPAMQLNFDLTPHLENIRNLLIFHGDRDEVVPLPHARTIFAGARHPKKLVVLKNGDHRMSNASHQEAFVREAIRWYRTAFEL